MACPDNAETPGTMAPETQSADTREAADPTTDDLLVTPRASVHEVTADVLQLSAGLEIPGKTSEEVAAMIQEHLASWTRAQREIDEAERADAVAGANNASGSRKRKRGNGRRNAVLLPQIIKDRLHVRRQEWLHVVRCIYFIELDRHKAVQISNSIFGDIKGGKPGLVTEYFRYRTGKNFSNWQFTIIENMIAHVRRLMEDPANQVFKKEKTPSSLSSHFASFFDIEEFLKIFSFLNQSANLRAASSKCQAWCKILYIEIGRRVKLHLHYLEVPARKRLAVDDYDRKSIIAALQEIGRSEKYQKHKPDWSKIPRRAQIERAPAKEDAPSEYKRIDEDSDAFEPDWDVEEEE